MIEIIFLVLFLLLAVILGISIFVSVFLFRRMLFVAEQTEIILELLENFKEHLEKINSADLFFGEPTILNLIEHSKSLIENIQDFLTTFSFMRSEKVVEEENEENAEIENGESTE
jgi:hypothetical protein